MKQGHPGTEMSLDEAAKDHVKKMIDRGEPLPAELRDILFPPEATRTQADKEAHDRATAFNKGFRTLSGKHWTTSHFGPKNSPPAHLLSAWSWRREVWYAYFLCCRALGNAYCRHVAGVFFEWNDSQRMMERLYHAVSALTFHNALEDRISQLANAAASLGIAECRVNFTSVFEKSILSVFPLSWKKASEVRKDADWQATHNLSNEVKHRWTGKLAVHEPHPQKVLDDLKSGGASYIFYGLTEHDPQRVDEICCRGQRSLNRLAELACVVDSEIGWDAYFHIVKLDGA